MSDPVARSNLVSRVRLDGYKLYYAAGKAEIVAQAREATHAVPAIARPDGVNSNLLHKWIKASDAAQKAGCVFQVKSNHRFTKGRATRSYHRPELMSLIGTFRPVDCRHLEATGG